MAKKKSTGDKRKPGRPGSGKKKLTKSGLVTPRFVFTLSDETKDKLKIVAERNGRTMSQEVAYAVRLHVARELGEPSPAAGS